MAAAAAVATAVGEATEGDGADVLEGKEDEADGGPSASVVSGGKGRGWKKKKGGKKGKTSRR